MTRGVLVLVLLIAGLQPAAAQQAAEPIRLAVLPAKAPIPALKYQFLPELRELTPGNAAMLYQRAHSPEWLSGYKRHGDYAKMSDWLSVPLKDFPRDKVKELLPRGVLNELELAAHREYCDWELSPRARKEGISLLLPELQVFREFATLLALRARLEMAEGRYGDAVRTLKTGIALGRNVSQAPTLIHALVGIAITQIMAGQVQELIQLPDAPNLYWALTALPRPMIDMRKPMQGERLFVDSLFPGIREAIADRKTPPMTNEQVQGMIGMLGGALKDSGTADFQGTFNLLAQAIQTLPRARRFLIEQGRTEEQAEAIPAAQAIVMFEVYNYDRMYDEMLKWQGLPYWETRAGMAQAEQQLREAKAKNSVGMTLATLMLPAVNKVNDAQVRIDRRIALLRCVEALRLHAASHDGKLPAALGDVRVVPVPADPASGRPFEYQMEGEKATLYAPPPVGEKPTPTNSLRYELTMKRK